MLLRQHLEIAGVKGAELFEKSDVRQPIRVDDLRATFVTLTLANGRTEAWVADRTGHRSSAMINRYRRAARWVAELGLGELAPLCDAIPELRATLPELPKPDQGKDEGKERPETSDAVLSRSPNRSEQDCISVDGSWWTRTTSQWIKSPRCSLVISTACAIPRQLTSFVLAWRRARPCRGHGRAALLRCREMSDERRALLRSLEGRPPDDALLARMEALFLDQGDTARARWVRLEREGYDQRTTHTNLRDVLGPDLAQEVLDAIVRTRTRRGALRVGDDGPVVHWPHFFVEPLPQLQEWRNRVVHKAGPIVAEFSIEPGSDEPHSLAFPGTVFIDVVNAITVELADALRRSAA